MAQVKRPNAGTVAVGAVLEPIQFVFCLPLLPSSSILAEDEKIRRMADNLAPVVCALVIERNCLRLIVILPGLRVVLHFIDGCKLAAVTLKLDSHAHFSAGVNPLIGTPATNAARRIRTRHPIDDR